MNRPREAGAAEYLVAAGLAAAAIIGRAAIGLFAPGVADFAVLLPAVVLAGVFCGTAPAAIAAALGGTAAAVLFLGSPLLAWPPLNATQMDVLLFLPACAAVLWATHGLRRTAATAADAEARLAEVFRQIPGAAAILEAPDGRLILRSTQSSAVLGQMERTVSQSGDLAGYGGIHPDGRPFAADDYPIVRALKTGEIVRGERFRYRQPTGRMVDLEVHAGPVMGPKGQIVASVGMAFDVSERAAAERRLRDSEAAYRAVAERLGAAIDAGALGLWEMDLATQRIHLDAALALMLGLPARPVEMERAAFQRFIDPADSARARLVLEGAVADGGAYADEVHMRTAQGISRWFVTRGAVLADMRKVVGVISDVTERRQREAALEKALEARDVLMHEADHRIKNSLQLVGSLLRLQQSRMLDPDARQALAEAIARVDAVADAHLALQISPDLRSIEIDRMLEGLCLRLGSLNPMVPITCEARSGLCLDAEDAIPLGLIASEALTNALRHAYPPGVAGEVVVSVGSAEGVLAMTIADGGVGLPATPRRPGLGTTVIATLARQIGATVASQGRAGQGTTVTVRLALPQPASAADVAPGVAAHGSPCPSC